MLRASGAGTFTPCCAVCERLNVKLVCKKCSKKAVREKQLRLKNLEEQSAGLKANIQDALLRKANRDEKRQVLADLALYLRKLSARKLALKERMVSVEIENEQRRVGNESSETELGEATHQMLRMRQEMLVNQLPDLIRIYKLQHRMFTEQLVKHQRLKMCKLRFMLPLRICPRDRRGADIRGSDRSEPAQFSICNIQIPTSMHFTDVSNKDFAAAFGYLLHFISLASMYLRIPLLHASHFQGSTSTLWQPRSFWDQRPQQSNSGGSAALPLFIPQQTEQLQTEKQQQQQQQQQQQSTPPHTGGGGTSSHCWSAMVGDELPKPTRKGLSLLKRSVGTLVVAEMMLREHSGHPLNLPPGTCNWGPIPSLAALCAALSRDPAASHPPSQGGGSTGIGGGGSSGGSRQMLQPPPPPPLHPLPSAAHSDTTTSSPSHVPIQSPLKSSHGAVFPSSTCGPANAASNTQGGGRGGLSPSTPATPSTSRPPQHHHPSNTPASTSSSSSSMLGSLFSSIKAAHRRIATPPQATGVASVWSESSFQGSQSRSHFKESQKVGPPPYFHAGSSSQARVGSFDVTTSNEFDEWGETDSEGSDGGWERIEIPTLPPPPSKAEDVEHWTRAMFTDATS